ncbi:malate synthase A [Wenzhouxiangella sediminis]|uniref:malate synthase n=1 Tax=Wenzhouxiangella sediminis TaxID=1792836 RepID=A0A3E1KC56_9GAMM|nr:malate synthase A [Wenzhouxiangella sediminis]RFF32308.1 malate synthase A [Wenzhouxiangella sediminis]
MNKQSQHHDPEQAGNGGLELTRELPVEAKPLFSNGLRRLLARLGERYRDRVDHLLAARQEFQARLDAGAVPHFPAETAEIRESDWKVAPIPSDLRDRRVEITGPVDRKMIINALNSGAKVFMADFEDSSTPSWENMIDGQVNLFDAVRRSIEFTADNGKHYRLNPDPAVLIVRPRGWHLDEKHVRIGGKAVPGGIFDAAVYLYNNAQALIDQGSGPYLYLPKLENRHEAELWERVLTDIEGALELKPGTIKVTVLIETITAVFEMDEILHALKSRIVGLNCGRWDYIFSYIKRLRAHSDKVLPDRAQVTMTVPFLKAYSQLLIKTCHRRGAFAMGGMAAQIPIKGDEKANAAAIQKVREDKEREAGDGHDGTWVAHPGLIPLAMEIFDEQLGDKPNQLDRLREDVSVTAEELVAPCKGSITEAGVRGNINVAIRYMGAWLAGQGCVPINHLMEDAATAEIARAQLWQWARHARGVLEDGTNIDLDLIRRWQGEELEKIRADLGDEAFSSGHFLRAAELLYEVTADDDFVEFLTLPGYDRLD